MKSANVEECFKNKPSWKKRARQVFMERAVEMTPMKTSKNDTENMKRETADLGSNEQHSLPNKPKMRCIS